MNTHWQLQKFNKLSLKNFLSEFSEGWSVYTYQMPKIQSPNIFFLLHVYSKCSKCKCKDRASKLSLKTKMFLIFSQAK